LNLGNGQFSTSPTVTHLGFCYTEGSVRALADINGDGLADLLFICGRVEAVLALGNGQFSTNPIRSYGGFDSNTRLGDVNGDGLADLVSTGESGQHVSVYLNLGNGQFSTSPTVTHLWFCYTEGSVRALADINGDGLADLLFICGRVDAVFATGMFPHMLESLTHEMGATTSLEYTSSVQYSNTFLPFVVQVVSSITVDDGLGNLSTTAYAYAGGHFDAVDREFRGFEYVKETNPDGTTLETWFHQDDYLKGRQYQLDLREPESSSLLSRTDLSWEKAFLDPPDNSCAFVKLAEKRMEFYDEVTVFTQEDYTYDDALGDLPNTHGDTIERVTSGTGGERIITTRQYRNYGPWLWRLTQETAEGSETGKVRETYYEYEAGSGNMLCEENWLDDGTNPITIMTYDDYGNQITVTDARGNTTTTDYDETTYTYPVRITYPETSGISYVIEKEWDLRFGKIAWERDENGNETDYGYDFFGRLEQVDYPDHGRTVTEYHDDVFPRYVVTRVTEDHSGNTIDSYEYFDGLGRQIQTITFGEDQRSIVMKTSYDEMGRKALVEGSFFGEGVGYPQASPEVCPWEGTKYDYRGRFMDVTKPDGRHGTVTTTFSYTGFSNTLIDPDGGERTETRDYLDRIIEVTEHTDEVEFHTHYSYNAAGDLLAVTDHHGNAMLMEYDSLGRKSSMDDPDMGHWEYTYDANGNLKTQTDAKGQITEFTYDELNRMTSKTYSTADPTVTYTYDTAENGRGRLYRVKNSDVTKTFMAYDEMGRVKNIRKKMKGDETPYTTQYEYDPSGKLLGITYPDGYQARYAYHPGSGLLHTVTGSDSLELARYSFYEPTGKIGQIEHGNGTATSYTYDPWSTRLLEIVTVDPSGLRENDIQRRIYSYTPAGDIEEIRDELRAITYRYGYDKLHRLRSETNTGFFAPIIYEYDALGNITSRTVGTNTWVFAYDGPRNHAVNEVSFNGKDYTYKYDENGNMTRGFDFTDPLEVGKRTINFNADNLPKRIKYTKGSAEIITRFLYDGDNVRAKKVADGGSTTYYVGDHLEITDGVATKYVFAGDMRIAKITDSGIHFYHKDHLGSSTAMTDANGTTVETAEYMPFGHERLHTGLVASNYKYTDQELDPETGLYNYGARLFDPIMGRFITPDTIVPDPYDPQTLNRYSYCRNNPLIYVDPTGQFFDRADPAGSHAPAPGSIGGDSDGENAKADDVEKSQDAWEVVENLVRDWWAERQSYYEIGTIDIENITASEFDASKIKIMRCEITPPARSVVRGLRNSVKPARSLLARAKALFGKPYPTKFNRAVKQPYSRKTGRYLSYDVNPGIKHSTASFFASGFSQGIGSGMTGARMPFAVSRAQALGQTIGYGVGSILGVISK